MVSIADCPVLKIALAGDCKVGKTTLLQRFMREDYTSLKGELTDIQVKYIERNGIKVKLEVTDTAGLERYRSLTQSYYQGVTSVIFVYDVNNKDSFENLMKWNDQYTKYCRDPINNQILIAGNKRQLTDTNTVATATARNFANHIQADFIEISTINDSNKNIDECFFRLADNFLEAHNKRRLGFVTSGINLNGNSTPRTKEYCCKTA